MNTAVYFGGNAETKCVLTRAMAHLGVEYCQSPTSHDWRPKANAELNFANPFLTFKEFCLGMFGCKSAESSEDRPFCSVIVFKGRCFEQTYLILFPHCDLCGGVASKSNKDVVHGSKNILWHLMARYFWTTRTRYVNCFFLKKDLNCKLWCLGLQPKYRFEAATCLVLGWIKTFLLHASAVEDGCKLYLTHCISIHFRCRFRWTTG